MNLPRLSFAVALALGLLTQAVVGEELSVAPVVPPRHHTNTVMFAWSAEEVAREAVSMKLAESFGGADEKSLEMMMAVDKSFETVAVSAEAWAAMDAAVAAGLQATFADYAERGIENAEDIDNAINK